MGQKTPGIYGSGDSWEVDKWWRGTRLRQRGFATYEEAEGWLNWQLHDLRALKLLGKRPARVFDSVAAHYLLTNQDKPSIVTEAFLLKGIMSHIGQLQLPQVHDGTLKAYIDARLKDGIAHKTINLALG